MNDMLDLVGVLADDTLLGLLSPCRLLELKMRILLVIFSAFLLTCDTSAFGQLPTATGLQIGMSQSAWEIFIPDTYQHRADQLADVLIHFHGAPQTVWNNAQYADLNAIIITVNYGGLSSAYSGPFSNARLFRELRNEALATLRLEADFPDDLQWDRLAVSSFSAGYGAVREILKRTSYQNDIDALVAADSLYASTAADGTPLDSQMEDYKTFASLAQAGSKSFLFSHSQVLTFTYENTMETGDELLQHLGISASAVNETGLGTLDFYRHAQSGNFQLWGASGNDGDAHLEHLRYLGEFLQHLPLVQPPSVAGDFDFDTDVDGADFLTWQRGESPIPFAIEDLADWEQNFGNDAALVANFLSVPEPTTSVLLMFGIVFLLSRRRSLRDNRLATLATSTEGICPQL